MIGKILNKNFWVKFWMIGKILNKNFPKKIRKMKNPHFLGGGVNDGVGQTPNGLI